MYGQEGNLRIEESSKDGDGSSKGVDGLDGCVEDDDGRDDDWYALHGVADAKCQRRDFVKWHVGDLVVEVVEYALSRHPPAFFMLSTRQEKTRHAHNIPIT